jgi:hypothetical protein
MTNGREIASANHIQSHRETIQQSLNEIAAELNSALVAAALAYPVYVIVPFGGD